MPPLRPPAHRFTRPPIHRFRAGSLSSCSSARHHLHVYICKVLVFILMSASRVSFARLPQTRSTEIALSSDEIRVRSGETSLAFVSCHLAAHAHKLAQRNEQCGEARIFFQTHTCIIHTRARSQRAERRSAARGARSPLHPSASAHFRPPPSTLPPLQVLRETRKSVGCRKLDVASEYIS